MKVPKGNHKAQSSGIKQVKKGMLHVGDYAQLESNYDMWDKNLQFFQHSHAKEKCYKAVYWLFYTIN